MAREIVSGIGHGAWCGRRVRKGFVCGVVKEGAKLGIVVQSVGKVARTGGWAHERVWCEGDGLAKVRVGDVVYGEGEWKSSGEARWLEVKGGVVVWRAARTWDEVD